MKIFINEIKEGDAFDSVFHLTEITKKETSKGKDYWILQLQDKTGTIAGKVWDATVWGDEPIVSRGDYIKVRAEAGSYRDKVDLSLRKVRRLDVERDSQGFCYEDFVPVGPQDRFYLIKSLQKVYEDNVRHPGLRAVCLAVFTDPGMHMDLRDAPAAREIHQPYIGGLIEHIFNLVNLVWKVAGYNEITGLGTYGNINLDGFDLLMAACLLHDIGKTRELKWKTEIGYTPEGNLIGHVGIGMEILQGYKPLYWEAVGAANAIQPEDWKRQLDRHSNLWMHLRHIIASHHGQLEWRAIAKPQSREATLFHMLDMIDSKMGMFDQIEKLDFNEDGFGPWSRDGRTWMMPE